MSTCLALLSCLPKQPTDQSAKRRHLKGTKAQEPRADLSPPKPSPKKGISGWDFDVAAIKAEAAKLDVMEEIAEGQVWKCS